MTVFQRKDVQRIRDILAKARGDADHAQRLATTMAHAITNVDKALRRSSAAMALREHALAEIFLQRHDTLIQILRVRQRMRRSNGSIISPWQ